MEHKELLARVKQDKVKFISLQFTDVTGAVKSVDIPVHRLPSALEDGVWFDGSSVEGFARIQESDMRLVLDPDTYAVLPWSPAEMRRGADLLRYLPARRRRLSPAIRAARSSACWQKVEAARLDLQCRPGAGILPVQAQRERARSTLCRMMSAAISISPPTTRPCACAPS